MSYLLDDAVAAEPSGDGVYRVTMTGDWDTPNGTANGGYVLAVLQHAAMLESAHPDPLVASVTYFRPPTPGPGEVHVREVRKGRRVSTYDAILVQSGKEIAHAVVSTHDWDVVGSAHHTPYAAPDVPRPEDCEDVSALLPPGLSPLFDRYRYRAPQAPGWMRGKPTGVTEGLSWIRAADDRPVDALLAGAMCDAFPPVTGEVGLLASATIQLTVHYRRRSDSQWALGHITTRHVIDGYHDEDVELWDEQGRLIAQSRQLAILSD